ncbi:hypothetical protein ANCDUO_13258 [Ancylostoma duodenale]|uniref:Uncharacterized protein n=1 Tax=Ancylostoma duodenale TaxID=51022 RepID=A0A0C2GHL6_9BILA|nr:hypothetical protein ANCDUO_13258 [Ancylostoma duodenale]
MVSDKPATHPRISEAEKEYIIKAIEESTGKHPGKPPSIPWISILKSKAVWACWIGHFAAIPYIAYFVMINVGGILADFVRSRMILGTLNTRRAAMLIGHWRTFVVNNLKLMNVPGMASGSSAWWKNP